MKEKKPFRRPGVIETAEPGQPRAGLTSGDDQVRLQVVLKCGSVGSVEAAELSLSALEFPGAKIELIHSGVGSISKSDLVMALTGSRLVLGFEVDLMPKLEQFIKEHGIEVRLYSVIYRLTEDVGKIARSFIAPQVEEKVTGKARVIALFKGSHKGIIVGCEVLEGLLEVGTKFQVIAAMGPVYTGTIESLQIEKEPVRKATVGQQVGLKIPDFKKAKLGDRIECLETPRPKQGSAWRPKGEVYDLRG